MWNWNLRNQPPGRRAMKLVLIVIALVLFREPLQLCAAEDCDAFVGNRIKDCKVKEFVENLTEGRRCIVYIDDGFHEDIHELVIDEITGEVIIRGQYGLPPEVYYHCREGYDSRHNRCGYDPKIDAMVCVSNEKVEQLGKLTACHGQKVWPWPLSNCWTYTETLWNEWIDMPDPKPNTKICNQANRIGGDLGALRQVCASLFCDLSSPALADCLATNAFPMSSCLKNNQHCLRSSAPPQPPEGSVAPMSPSSGGR